MKIRNFKGCLIATLFLTSFWTFQAWSAETVEMNSDESVVATPDSEAMSPDMEDALMPAHGGFHGGHGGPIHGGPIHGGPIHGGPGHGGGHGGWGGHGGHGGWGHGGHGGYHNPISFHHGFHPWPHWNHPYFPHHDYEFDWARLRFVTCVAADSSGDQYPVTENDAYGFAYQDRIDEIEEAALDRCHYESNDDACQIVGCNPGY